MNKKLNLISVLLIIFIGTSVYFSYKHNNLQKEISRHYENVYTTINNGIMEVSEDIDSVKIEGDNINSQLSVQLGRVQELRFATTALPDALANKYTYLLKEIYNELYQIINNDEDMHKKGERLERVKEHFKIFEEISKVIDSEKQLDNKNGKFFLEELGSNRSSTLQEIDKIFKEFIN